REAAHVQHRVEDRALLRRFVRGALSRASHPLLAKSRESGGGQSPVAARSYLAAFLGRADVAVHPAARLLRLSRTGPRAGTGANSSPALPHPDRPLNAAKTIASTA